MDSKYDILPFRYNIERYHKSSSKLGLEQKRNLDVEFKWSVNLE